MSAALPRGLLHTSGISEATFELRRILLPDNGHLHEEEAECANRYVFSKHRPALPLL